MKHAAILAAGVCLSGSIVRAQDPVKTDPKVYQVVLDNARVRVLRVNVAAGAKTSLHEHPDNMTILLTDGKITFTGANGKSETVETKAGQALWSGPQKHMGANASAAPLEAIVVELKGSAVPTATLPATRPNITMKPLATSPRADALLGTADAAFKEAPATKHDYDQIVIAPGAATFSIEIDGKTKTTWKRGDVMFIGRGQAHQAQNTSGKPVDLILVAIK